MPREASCKCGECRLCKQRECQAQARRRFTDVVWPADAWGEEARKEAERLMGYSSSLADPEAWLYQGRSKRATRRAGAE